MPVTATSERVSKRTEWNDPFRVELFNPCSSADVRTLSLSLLLPKKMYLDIKMEMYIRQFRCKQCTNALIFVSLGH